MPINDAATTLVSGMIANSKNQDIISNNIANVDTTGFKKDQVSFETTLDASKLAETARFNRPRNLYDEVYYGNMRIDVPVKINHVYTHHTPGNIVTTGGSLDVALQGDAFFTIQTEQGERYTKAGRFNLDGNGILTNPEGYPVLGKAGPIRIEGNTINILEGGEIQVDGETVDRLKMVRAQDNQDFMKEGNSWYRFIGPVEELEEVTNPSLLNGFLEKSNISSIQELNAMTLNMRTFESEARAFRDITRTIERAINSVGKS